MTYLAFQKKTSWIFERLKTIYNMKVDRGVGEWKCEKGPQRPVLCCENKGTYQPWRWDLSLPMKETEIRALVVLFHGPANLQLVKLFKSHQVSWQMQAFWGDVTANFTRINL